MSVVVLEDQALTHFDSRREEIAKVKSLASLTVAVDGIGKVEDAHKAVKRFRVDIEKTRVALKAGALAYGKKVDSVAKDLTAEIEPVEYALKSERDKHEAEKERKRQEVEAVKQAKRQGRVNEMVAAGVEIDWAAAEMPDDIWTRWFADAKATAEQQRAIVAEEARLAAEAAELERIEREVAAQRLREQQEEEAKRQAEELLIRAEEIERQRLSDESAMADERARLKAEREEIERQQAELQQQQEEAKKIEEQKAAEAEKAEQMARQLALQPEIEKAEAYCQMLKAQSDSWFGANGEQRWTSIAINMLNWACRDIMAEVRK